MHRFEYLPPPSLQKDMKYFWVLEEGIDTYNRDSIIPDSYVELVINVGAPLYMETDGAPVSLPRVFINGLQRKPLKLRATGLCQFISMKMYPWGMMPILGMPAKQEAEISLIPMDGAWQDFAKTLVDTVQHYGYAEAVDKLQEFVCERQSKSPADIDTIRGATQSLYDSAGQTRMEDLAMQAALSASQFERRFKYMTGVTPKTMARLIRFERICHTLFLDPLRRATDLAYEFGYTDQAHFIHDFKAFAAQTPGEFITRNAEQLQAWQEWHARKKAEFLQSAPA